MIYLDNAATSAPKAPGVVDAVTEHLAAIANPGRGAHRRAAAAERMIDDCRLRMARLLGIDDHRRLIHTLNATDGLNLVIRGVLDPRHFEPGFTPHVLTTVLEHNSITRPLMDLRDQGRVEVTQMGCDELGFVHAADFVANLQPNTVLVAFPHVSNALATVQDVEGICAAVRGASDALLLVDAAQSVGTLDIDVATMGADFIAFPGHKGLLGPTGTGGLYVGSRAITDAGDIRSPRVLPLRHGGTGGDSTHPVMPPELPHFLEGGTPNTLGIAGLRAGVMYVAAEGVATIRAHEQDLTTHLLEAMVAAVPAVRVVGPPTATGRIGAVSFVFPDHDPADLAGALDAGFDIAVRPGMHCAPYAHAAMGTAPAGTLRVSFGPFNTHDDIDQLIAAVGRCVE